MEKKIISLMIFGLLIIGIGCIGPLEDEEVTDENDIDEDLDQYELIVNIEGEGEVNIEPEKEEYEEGEEVTLTAEPEEDWIFQGWTGDIEGSEEEFTITMDEDKEVTATFITDDPVLHQLKLQKQGEGEVKINGEKIEEWPHEGIHEEDKELTITAEPEENWYFDQWIGDLERNQSTQKENEITMNKGKEITALFVSPENITTEEENCYQDIKEAREFSKEQEACTAEYREMQCPHNDYVYGAPDGCQIGYLEERNWTEVTEETYQGEEGDVEGALSYSKEQENCEEQYKELESPDGNYFYEASDECQVNYLEERDWRETTEEDREIVKESTEDEECGWVSTNCCPPQSGANWECVNIEETTIECPENPVCLHVYVGRPKGDCVSLNNTCTAVDNGEGTGYSIE